jgi:ATP-binding cassette subfamily B protein
VSRPQVILARYAWWEPIVLVGAWLATHWLLRESAIWRVRNTEEVRGAQRDADYAYRLAADPPASKELRLFGLAGWTIDRFIARRTRLLSIAISDRVHVLVLCLVEPVPGSALRRTRWKRALRV